MRCGRADIVDNGRIEKSYIYANGQIVAGHDGGATAARRFYLHDRLGWVRQVMRSWLQVLQVSGSAPATSTCSVLSHAGAIDMSMQIL